LEILIIKKCFCKHYLPDLPFFVVFAFFPPNFFQFTCCSAACRSGGEKVAQRGKGGAAHFLGGVNSLLWRARNEESKSPKVKEVNGGHP
jgi:hypothetical protein